MLLKDPSSEIGRALHFMRTEDDQGMTTEESGGVRPLFEIRMKDIASG